MDSRRCGYERCLAVRISYTRSALDAYMFLNDMLEWCESKPLITVDRWLWYSWALNELEKWRYERFGVRNSVERFFDTVKKRTMIFGNSPHQLHPQIHKSVHRKPPHIV
ncbi:MAG: hypothetical protein QXJ86_02795 [Nitrososphaerales archaeon]